MKKEDTKKEEKSRESDSESQTEDTEDSEYKEETEETSEDTEEIEDTEETEETEEYIIDKGCEKVCNRDCQNEIINDNPDNQDNQDNPNNPDNYFNKYQEENNNQMIYLILNTNAGNDNNTKRNRNVLNLSKHPINKKTYRFYNKYSSVEKKYFDVLSDADKTKLIDNEDIIEKTTITYDVPMRFKILTSDINIRTKKSILWKIESLNKMNSNSSEYYKLSSWILKLPTVMRKSVIF
jgi:hypothetical protein